MKDSAFFCPSCGSSSVKVSALAGGDASCDACEWKGSREEMVNLPFEHNFASKEEMISRFVNQLASSIAKSSALDVGRILLQWGFLDEKRLQEELKIYIRVMAVAATKAVIEARQHMERARAAKAAKHGN